MSEQQDKKVSLHSMGVGLVFGVMVGLLLASIVIPAAERLRQPSWNSQFQAIADDGHAAGTEGVPPEACPYASSSQFRKSWLEGWRKGRLEAKGVQP